MERTISPGDLVQWKDHEDYYDGGLGTIVEHRNRDHEQYVEEYRIIWHQATYGGHAHRVGSTKGSWYTVDEFDEAIKVL